MMIENFGKFASMLLLGFIILILPTPLFSAEINDYSDNELLERWIENENFFAFPINIRLKLLEKLAKEPRGDRIFSFSMESFNKFFSFGIKEIDTRMDLKRLLESFRLGRLKFYVSDKIKTRGDIVFKNCTFKHFLEQLSRKYGLRIFYCQSELYIVPHTDEPKFLK